MEFSEIENVTEAFVPVGGTDPEPDQPVQIQTVPFSLIGLVTVQVTESPSLYRLSPLGGLGLPWGEETCKSACPEGVMIQFHVMVEFWLMVKVVEVPVPLDGTEPVPVQPVQV